MLMAEPGTTWMAMTSDDKKLLRSLEVFYNIYNGALGTLQASHEPGSMMVVPFYHKITTE